MALWEGSGWGDLIERLGRATFRVSRSCFSFCAEDKRAVFGTHSTVVIVNINTNHKNPIVCSIEFNALCTRLTIMIFIRFKAVFKSELATF